MRIRRRFAFGTRRTELLSFLTNYGIECEDAHGVSVFYLYEDEENFDAINNFMKANKSSGMRTAEYTKDELNSAKWLTVQSTWFHLNPRPDLRRDDDDFLPKTYDVASIECHECKKGLKQKWSFIVDKDPKWGARNFFHLKWMRDELFISKRAENALVANGLTGYEFWDVLRTSGKVIDGVKQLKITSHIAEGLNRDTADGTFICQVCNMERYYPPKVGVNMYSAKSFEGVQADIVKTKENIGAGDYIRGLILVTQKFRKVVMDEKLDKGLIFEPVTLV